MNASPLLIVKLLCFSVLICSFPWVTNRIENPGANSRQAFLGLNRCDLKQGSDWTGNSEILREE
jgi:hypothetical protein